MLETAIASIQEMKFESGKDYVVYFDLDKTDLNNLMRIQIYLSNKYPKCGFMLLPNYTSVQNMSLDTLAKFRDMADRRIKEL